MVAAYEVPGTVTYRDVARAVQGESPAARTRRLAAKAVIEGCAIVWPEGDGYVAHVGVTSATASGVVYVVEVASGSCACTCPGYARHGYCKHGALVAVTCFGEPTDPAGTAVAEPVDMGAILDARDGEYPTPAERAALVKRALRRGVTLEHVDGGAVATDPRTGRHDVTALGCNCQSFAWIGECQHRALYLASASGPVAGLAA